MPQLDALRAFAVFPVLIEHFVKTTDTFRVALPWGGLGVRLFFVLSGFLITGILLRARREFDQNRVTFHQVLKTFFARRFLRLMPVYYAYLLAIALLMPAARQYLLIFALYLQNFLFALRPKVFELMLAHFWTLAVEEQFYLCWPFVILLVPRRWLPIVLSAIVLTGPVCRTIGLLLGFTSQQVEMMMPAHFDTLGIGGLLSVLQQGETHERVWGQKLVAVAFWLGLPLTLLVSSLSVRVSWPVATTIASELSMGLFFTWAVSGAARGFRGFGGRVLDSALPQYLGKISYGIYVYHFNVPGLIRDKIAARLGLPLPDDAWLRFSIFAAVTVAAAAASWRLMEQPISRLKQRFFYLPAS
jgi:peptidoglycan/LPS O-acetylase OafA/YrhL